MDKNLGILQIPQGRGREMVKWLMPSHRTVMRSNNCLICGVKSLFTVGSILLLTACTTTSYPTYGVLAGADTDASEVLYHVSEIVIPTLEMSGAGNSAQEQMITRTQSTRTVLPIIFPTGHYSERHTDSHSSTSGSRNTQSSGGCVTQEDRNDRENGSSTVRRSTCSGSSQTKSSRKTKSYSSSVGFSVDGPVGAVLGMMQQMDNMNRADEARAQEMFKAFGF